MIRRVGTCCCHGLVIRDLVEYWSRKSISSLVPHNARGWEGNVLVFCPRKKESRDVAKLPAMTMRDGEAVTPRGGFLCVHAGCERAPADNQQLVYKSHLRGPARISSTAVATPQASLSSVTGQPFRFRSSGALAITTGNPANFSISMSL